MEGASQPSWDLVCPRHSSSRSCQIVRFEEGCVPPPSNTRNSKDFDGPRFWSSEGAIYAVQHGARKVMVPSTRLSHANPVIMTGDRALPCDDVFVPGQNHHNTPAVYDHSTHDTRELTTNDGIRPTRTTLTRAPSARLYPNRGQGRPPPCPRRAPDKPHQQALETRTPGPRLATAGLLSTMASATTMLTRPNFKYDDVYARKCSTRPARAAIRGDTANVLATSLRFQWQISTTMRMPRV